MVSRGLLDIVIAGAGRQAVERALGRHGANCITVLACIIKKFRLINHLVTHKSEWVRLSMDSKFMDILNISTTGTRVSIHLNSTFGHHKMDQFAAATSKGQHFRTLCCDC